MFLEKGESTLFSFTRGELSITTGEFSTKCVGFSRSIVTILLALYGIFDSVLTCYF